MLTHDYSHNYFYRAGEITALPPHRYYLVGELLEPANYVDLFHLLDAMQEHESLNLYLNGPGGDLFTCIQLVNKINLCKGTVTTIAEGQQASAHSIIFFSGHQLEILPNTIFMMHDASGGAGGKFNENLAASKAMSKLLEGLYKEVYGKFFDDEYINSILEGKDAWLLASEVEEVLQKYVPEAVDPQEEEEERTKY